MECGGLIDGAQPTRTYLYLRRRLPPPPPPPPPNRYIGDRVRSGPAPKHEFRGQTDTRTHTHTHTHKAAVYRRTEAGARHRGQRNGERQKWIDTGGPRNRFRPGVVHKVDAGDAVSRMPASAAAAALIGAPASAQFRSRSGGRLCPANWIFMLPCRPRKVGFGKFTRIWKSLGFNWIF